MSYKPPPEETFLLICLKMLRRNWSHSTNERTICGIKVGFYLIWLLRSHSMREPAALRP